MKKLLIGIRNILPAVIVALFLIPACSKNNNGTTITTTGNSYVSVTNASASSQSYNAYIDSSNITTSAPLTFGSTTGSAGNPYDAVIAGSHQVKLSANGTTFIVDTSINFAANQHYSVFAYDTSMAGGNLKTLILTDNLSAPASGQSEIRFLPLSPNTSAMTVLLVNGTDTLSLKNTAYIGASVYSMDSLSAYTALSSGTYQVVVNNLENINLLTADSVTLASGKIYTLYSKGYSGLTGANALSVGVIQQN